LQTENATDTGGTINELISNAGWAQKRSSAIAAGHGSAQVGSQDSPPDSPQEEMIAPELVFTKDSDDDDER
jgi:hypothetical protein